MQHITLRRRLAPLYLAAIFQSAVLWYATEKIFMGSIGFTTASIGVAAVLMTATMLVLETPLGILADRWSRKGVLMIGCAALFLCALVGAFSINEAMYFVSAIMWGVYGACYSGTFEAIIYDATVESEGSSRGYKKHLGRLRIFEGSSFIVAALVGGLVATALDARATFFLSLPLIAVAFVFLWRFKQPNMTHTDAAMSTVAHVQDTFSAVLRSRTLLPIVVATVGFLVLQDLLFQLSQLWFIAVAAPIVLFGLFSAVLSSSWIGGGIIARYVQSKTSLALVVGVVMLSVGGLVFARDYWLILVSQAVLVSALVGLGIVLSKAFHDELPSQLRTGAASVVSTLARIVLIPTTLLVTGIAQREDIFVASYVLFGLVFVAAAGILLYRFSRTYEAEN